ncbi:uncharacterized protein ACIBXB_005885 [Morphnus guianensis]
MRNKTKSQNTFPPPLPSSQAQLHSRILYQPPPAAQGDGDGVYTHHTLFSAASSSSGGGLITVFPCSSVGSHPRETVLHELLQRGSFPQAAVLHKLLQHGSFPRCAVLQAQTAPAWAPHGVTSPARKPAPWAPLSTDPQVLPGACSSAGFPRGHSLLRETHLLRRGVLHGLQVDICSTMDLHGLQGDSLPHHGLHHRLQGNLCSGAWSTSSPSFFTDLGVCRVVSLTCSHSSLWLQFLCHSNFFPPLEYVITEVLPLSLIGLALASSGSVLEPAGIGSVGHRGSFSQLLTEATPVTPPPPRYQNLGMETQYKDYEWRTIQQFSSMHMFRVRSSSPMLAEAEAISSALGH